MLQVGVFAILIPRRGIRRFIAQLLDDAALGVKLKSAVIIHGAADIIIQFFPAIASKAVPLSAMCASV
jgi:hypothetical protein